MQSQIIAPHCVRSNLSVSRNSSRTGFSLSSFDFELCELLQPDKNQNQTG